MAKQQPTFTIVPEQMLGETNKQYEQRCLAVLFDENIRTRGDLREWKPGHFFSFSTRDPV